MKHAMKRHWLGVLASLVLLLVCLGAATLAHAGTVAYTYDAAGRLTAAHYGAGKSITFSYDAAGNLLQRTVDDGRVIHTVTFTAGVNGTLTGDTPQLIPQGESTSAVAAVPAAGHHFLRWIREATAYSTDNPLTVIGVSESMDLEAEFAIDTYTLTYTAGAGGSITGPTPQTVDHGADGTAVTAASDAAHHFVQWSDGSDANPRTDTAVTAPVAVTAEFAINTYTLTYTAGAGGSITGPTPQAVDHGDSAAAVTAVADADKRFDRWTSGGVDLSSENPLIIPDVSADMVLTAHFRDVGPSDPDGSFVVAIPPGAFAAGAALWDLSGHYEMGLEGDALSLDLVHDSKGKITGGGQYTTDLPTKALYSVVLTAKGGGKGKSGTVLVKLGLKGQAVGIPGDASAKA